MKNLIIVIALAVCNTITAQHSFPFQAPGKSWKYADDFSVDYESAGFGKTVSGKEILFCDPARKETIEPLVTVDEYGDVDVQIDFSLLKNASAVICLSNQYNIHLADSWANAQTTAGSLGGISVGDGVQGNQGFSPRSNNSRAPGLWQTMLISYRGPRYDSAGKRTENARIVKMELNGTLIHENVQLPMVGTKGIDRGRSRNYPITVKHVAGALAFRNFTITAFDGTPPVLTDINYSVLQGKFEFIPDYSEYEPVETGKLDNLTTAFLNRESEFVLRFIANVVISTKGTYVFQRETNGGGYVKVNNVQVSDLSSYETKPIVLEPGTYPIEVGYLKPYNWFPNSFGLKVSADNIREFLISDPRSLAREFPDPVIIDPAQQPLMRSFIDIPGGKRIVHAISAGSVQQLNYSYDLDNGTLFQGWRGRFLDAGSMWVGRGDGSARAISTPVYFAQPASPVFKMNDAQTLNTDTAGSNFINLGYEVVDANNTIYSYSIFNTSLSDKVTILTDGRGYTREVTCKENPTGLFYRIAEGKNIRQVSKTLFTVNDKLYYIRFDDAKLSVRVVKTGGKELLVAELGAPVLFTVLF